MTEHALRQSLGVPAEAKRVLLFVESSHWDTNWLSTSEEYFADRVEPIFDQVIAALRAEPTRVYCIESVFFLKRYWESRPDSHATLRDLFARRQLRLMANSFTTPDTLLPHSETVLRDFQLGHEWLKAQGLPDAPGTAYFPDNFGHSPHVPSLMQSVGVHSVALTRIDGMYFIGADWKSKTRFPLPNSTAELLEKVYRSHDFVWRDNSGAEVLCHWNAHTYFLGDMLAHKGVIRWAGKTFALPWRTRRHIASRIDGYCASLEPYARTPYLLCPIGMDFNDPIKGLTSLLQRYNQERYPQTGTWAVVAGLDDAFALIDCHRAALPVLEADPNPYWMGFLATRPEVKQRPNRIAKKLLLAERISSVHAADPVLEKSLSDAWSKLVLSNHHDYIPGTSPDRVWEAEQKPWLDLAEAAADHSLSLVRKTEGTLNRRGVAGAIGIDDRGQSTLLETAHFKLTVSRADGGCLASFVTGDGELLKGLGFDLISFHDDGGLWRLGHEFVGGRFEEVERASQRPSQVHVERHGSQVTVRIHSELGGERFLRRLDFEADSPLLRLTTRGIARPRTTLTCRFEVAVVPDALAMDTVGGEIARPRERQYSPTFWAVPSRLTLDDGKVMHALFESPSAVSVGPTGALEWIVARNAPKERAFGWLPVPAHPIGGTNPDVQVHHAALMGRGALASARRALELHWLPEHHREASEHAEELVQCDHDRVMIKSVRRSGGDGELTVRLYREDPLTGPVRVWLRERGVTSAWICDALDRQLQSLTVEPDGRVVVPLTSRLTSVRFEGVRQS